MLETILSVLSEVAKCLAPPTERQVSYLRGYNKNFENLKKDVEETKGDRATVQHKVDEAKRQGEEIEKNVDEWLESVSNAIVEAEKLVGIHEATENKRCFKGLCPNLKDRLQLSKAAVRQQDDISKLREAGRLFDRISYRSILEDIQFLSSRDYEAFESRMSTLNDILGTLKDPDVNMLGVYGMGGIGKTTLAKEVASQVKSEFDQVVFIEVSQSQDIRKIQGEIADKLGLRLHEESASGRAMTLYNRLKNEKRILIILDNIWENLDLHAVGIPYGDDYKGCKVLLTARSEDVLSRKMDSQRNFQVGVLKEEEAWSLFRKMAGDYIEGIQFKSIATDVAEECAGLPISIITVGRALRNKRLVEWKDALEQLKRPSSANFQNIQSAAYSAIELSYNKLEGEELKKIFLLIAYTNIGYIGDLLKYGVGLGLFGGINHMKEARARVQTLIYRLKASCMLLDDSSLIQNEMHDVVRDVAISIASREQNVMTVTNGELVNQWESSKGSIIKSCTAIILIDVNTNSVLPEELDCPQLKLFYIEAARRSSSLTIPENFFTKMIEVRVLDLHNMHLVPLPSSLGLLTNLRTLCLYDCILQDISVVGNFKKLEILCLQAFEIERLPEEVGKLTRLKLLDLRFCYNIKVIPPNVLSKLCCLEELCTYSFKNWGLEVKGLRNASLDELKHLPNLTSLELQIKDVNTLPRDLFFEKLERFEICIGEDQCWWEKETTSCRKFKLQLNTNICLKDGLIVQLKGVEDLCLSGMQGQDFKYFVNELVTVGSLQLKRLYVRGCDSNNPRESKIQVVSTTDMRSNEIISDDDSFFIEKVKLPNLELLSLHSVNVERIWQSQLAAMSCGIQNLTDLHIHGCWNLKSLFSYSIHSSCVRLKNLKIEKCPVLEEIIIMDQTERKNVMFPQLQSLEIRDMEKLTSFCTEDVHVEFPSLKQIRISECYEFMGKYKNSNHDLTKKVSVSPDLEYVSVEEKYMPLICQFTEDFGCKLKGVEVILKDDESTIISSLELLHRIHPIKVLQLQGGTCSFECFENGMVAIISKANKFFNMKHILKSSVIINNLERLEMWNLECENLINIVPSSTMFQNLTALLVGGCMLSKKLLTSSAAKSLVRLREMMISDCDSITEIVANDEGDNDAEKDEIIFRELKELYLCDLKYLTSFCSVNCTFKFPSLENLVVDGCLNMKIFFGGELSTPKLRKVRPSLFHEDRWIWEGDLNTTIQQHYLKTQKKVKSLEEEIGQPSMQLLE